MLSTTSFDWTAVSARLAGVRDDELRSESLMIAQQLWERRAARGKACSLPTLCWRAVQLARRRARRNERIAGHAVYSLVYGIDDGARHEFRGKALAAKPAVERIDVSRALASMTDRQRTIAAGLMDGRSGREIAESIGVHPGQVSREIERMAGLFA